MRYRYIRWVCTKCGAVAVTEGRRPSPHGGNRDCLDVARKKRKNEYVLPTQTHRWVKDGPATQEEYKENAAEIEDRKKFEAQMLGCTVALLIIIFLGFVIAALK